MELNLNYSTWPNKSWLVQGLNWEPLDLLVTKPFVVSEKNALEAYTISPHFLHFVGSSTKAIPDSQSFLFTLANPSGNEPVKMAPKPGASILCNSNLGPTLGTTQYYDLLVWSVSSTNDSVSSHLDLGHGFVCPDSINKNSYFTGRNPFEISELEVFQVTL